MKLLLVLSACVALSTALSTANIRWSIPKRPLNTPFDVSPRIINGQEVTPHSIPYQTWIEVTGSRQSWLCGGVVLSNNYVLTAGHCGLDALSATVWFGAHDITKKEATQVKIASRRITVYPGYSEDTLVNDVSIIQLQTPVTFNANIQPVKLPSRSDAKKTYAGEQGRVSGWGLTTGRGTQTSPVLRSETSAVLTNAACGAQLNLNIGNEIICLTGATQKGSCSGDSGGPLIAVAENTLIGVVSFGLQYCPVGTPSAFTRVTTYLDWIEKNSDVTIAN